MTNTLDALTAEFQNYVVAPLNAFGIGGFVFDVEGETTAVSNAEITDHYAEDNRALQDHIAIRPKKITLKGYVGEVVYAGANGDGSILQSAVQKLTAVSQFLPTLSAAATQVVNSFNDPNPPALTLSDAANIYSLVKNIISNISGDTPKQQQAYSYFNALQAQGILMGIQTPWEFLTNMAIESIVATQPEWSRYITDFSVTFKQIRIAKTVGSAYTSLSPSEQVALDVDEDSTQQFQGVAALQAPTAVPIGNVPGVSLPSSSLPGPQSQILDVSSLYEKLPIKGIFIPPPPPSAGP